jgi:hypothetical protein
LDRGNLEKLLTAKCTRQEIAAHGIPVDHEDPKRIGRLANTRRDAFARERSWGSPLNDGV